MNCECCGVEYHRKNEDGNLMIHSVSLLKPQSEWNWPDLPEFEHMGICPYCSTSLLWDHRMKAVQYAEDDKRRDGFNKDIITEGLTDDEKNMLVGDNDDAIDGKR